MDLNLSQTDLSQVGSISSRNTIKVLPSNSKKKRQKFAVGDDQGNLTALQMKKGEAQNVFKTIAIGGKISCLELGGSADNKDKMFVSCDQKIVGVTKKGKEFFKFQSNLTEKINCICVEDTRLWTATDYVYNQFDNGADKNFFMCQDRINALTVEHITKESDYNAILGCSDKSVRVIQDSQQVLKKSVSGPLSALSRFPIDAKGPKRFLFATENGQVGQLLLKTNKLHTGWKLPEGYKGACVNCIDVFDLTKDGTPNVMVGRDDGKVQVFSLTDSGVKLDFEYCDAESIRGIDSGVVCTPTFNEVLMCTYGGKIITLTTEQLEQPDTEDSYGRTKASVMRSGRILKMRKEIQALEEKLAKEKERVAKPVGDCVAPSEEFNVNAKFVLDPDEAAYILTVEIPMPMDIICFQSAIPVDLLDSSENKAIVNRCPPDPDNNSILLATYRCQDSTNRMETRMRTVEGQYGDLNMTVIGSCTPKSAQTLKFNIKPLSLHHRVDSLDESETGIRVNVLRLSGSFSLIQMHEWLAMCLPNVPARIQEGDEELELFFRNVFLKSILTCKYKKGDAVFSSQSVSSLAILKEIITKEATSRKIQVNLRCDIDDQTIGDFLLLIHPKLNAKVQLARQVELIDAIKEIHMQEGDTSSWMSAEYQEILQNADKIKSDFGSSPRALEYLSGIITDLYLDLHKFKGNNVSHKIPDLMKLLQNYNFDKLVAFFKRDH